MKRVEIKIQGLEEFGALLSAVGVQTRPGVMNAATRAGAREVMKEVKKRTPVDTGELKRSEVVRSGRFHAGLAGGTSFAHVRFRRPRGRIAHLLEFGTKRGVAARRFIRSGTDAAVGAAVEAQIKVLARGIIQAMRRSRVSPGLVRSAVS
jgi:HK97 gp10 family phage protein